MILKAASSFLKFNHPITYSLPCFVVVLPSVGVSTTEQHYVQYLVFPSPELKLHCKILIVVIVVVVVRYFQCLETDLTHYKHST